MCREAVENIDEAEDGGGQARHEDNIELKYPGGTDEGGDEGKGVTEDQEDDGSDSRRLRADIEGDVLLEGGWEYKEAYHDQERGQSGSCSPVPECLVFLIV